MSAPNELPTTPLPAWRVILSATFRNALDSVFYAVMIGVIFSTMGPETGEPSGKRLGLLMAACTFLGSGLAGFGIGIARVLRRSRHTSRLGSP